MKSPEKPIIFVGAPRSGTTVIFNVFAARRDLAWFSQHFSRFPRWPSLTVLNRLADVDAGFRKSIGPSGGERPWRERLRVGPSEAYPVWSRYCDPRFPFDFMLGIEADEPSKRRMRRLVERMTRYQGKRRFATKITGPTRIGYLSSIFPDARFVHVIRDGRAVVNSLLDVHFWHGTWRERQPAWDGGLSERDLTRWHELGESPMVLAALQWRAIIRGARKEARRVAADRYAELRYEDFVAHSARALDAATAFCELPRSPQPHAFLANRVEVRDMNYRWRERFQPDQRTLLAELLADELAELGYEPPTAGDHLLRRPFA